MSILTRSRQLLTGLAMGLAMTAMPLTALGEGESLSEHMREHFAWATQVQTAVINADLQAARVGANWLSTHQAAEAFPENALDEMRMAAQGVVDAENILEASMAVGRMGAACGHCHSLMSVRTGLESNVNLPVGDELKDRMARHLWAADRMWEGLVSPSDLAWNRGAEVLKEAPLSGELVTGSANATISQISQQIADLADRAQHTFGREQRAVVYGGFLARCSACHKSFRGTAGSGE